MKTRTILDKIAGTHGGLFLVRSSARSIVERRPIRGVLELLCCAQDDAAMSALATTLAQKLAGTDLLIAISSAPSVTAYLERCTLPFNRLAVSVDTSEVIELDSEWNRFPLLIDVSDPENLLDWCLRVSEQGFTASKVSAIIAHPVAARILSVPRVECMRRLTQILVSRYPIDGLRCLDEVGLLVLLLPEVSGLKGFHLSSPHHHKDVYEHTLKVVSQSVPTPLVRWSALLHDVGKLHTRSFTPTGQVHFFKHDEVGAYLCDGITFRLAFPSELCGEIHRLVLLHLRPGLYTSSWSDAAVRRLVKEAGSVLGALFDLARADNTTKRMSKRLSNLRNVKALSDRCAQIVSQDRTQQIRLPRGLGNAIIRQFELEPGPRIGELCVLCSEGVRDGRLAQDATVEHHLAFLRNTPGLMNSLPGVASSLSN
jgi:poly(A) polymerase